MAELHYIELSPVNLTQFFNKYKLLRNVTRSCYLLYKIRIAIVGKYKTLSMQ